MPKTRISVKKPAAQKTYERTKKTETATECEDASPSTSKEISKSGTSSEEEPIISDGEKRKLEKMAEILLEKFRESFTPQTDKILKDLKDIKDTLLAKPIAENTTHGRPNQELFTKSESLQGQRRRNSIAVMERVGSTDF